MAVSKKAIEDAHVNRRKTFKEYNTANAVVNPSAQEIARRVSLKQDWRVAQKVCLNIATAAFSLFRRKLDGTAKQQWDMIDTEVHSNSTHTDLQGLTVDGPKGRSWVRFFSALKSTNVMYLRLMQLTNNVVPICWHP